MTDTVKLIIEIPKSIYESVQKKTYCGSVYPYLEKAIPLPKGHGKIGDIDELHNIFKSACNAYNINNLAFISDVDMHFDLADAIMEADAESKG